MAYVVTLTYKVRVNAIDEHEAETEAYEAIDTYELKPKVTIEEDEQMKEIKTYVTIYKFEFKDDVGGTNPFVAICKELDIPNPKSVMAVTFDCKNKSYTYEDD